MGTKGLFGFKYKNIYYLVYNQYDSYFSYLGINLLTEIKTALKFNRIDEWKKKIEKLKIVKYNDEPTAEDIEKLSKSDLTNSTDLTDWFYLLENRQQSYSKILDSGYVYSDVYNERSIDNHVGIEYQYILNFDDSQFEIKSSSVNICINIEDIKNVDFELLNKEILNKKSQSSLI